ncbi:uncharacterized protein B0T15DRAFT_520676 [Chaetomium strumarium]|uniref:Endopolyphosphatase n=1 Tax=Chaetomium strumarium TaxID=1170767 RepID=A0AAJ0H3L1_9PEZI|nr:hypothetical protein B0T15DRAFT_520676 [Chaetomium strumarium]
MTIPVVPNFGNNDILPHNILLPGPNKWFQTYLHVWRRFVPEEQRHSFEFGGWFHVEVIPNKLAVFSLNTLYFFDRNAGVDGCANPGEPGYKQMEWLRVQLQFLRERGMKAILIGHVPPARTESKKLWDETCWQKYTLWMHQFRDVVVVGLYGHMNIDHFLIHDSDGVDIAALSGSSQRGIRQAMEDDLSVQGASDYLMELRQHWAKLPPPPTFKSKADGVNGDGKRRTGKKHKDPWGERYHLTLVSPSIVPNYFPTLRVFEYNITGLEHAPVWKDAQQGGSQTAAEIGSSQKHLELRQLSVESELQVDLDDITSAKKRGRKKKKKEKKPKKKPKNPVHDPNLNVPSPPVEGSPPGPAYAPQPLTLLGYTQYFANLTHINNLNLTDVLVRSDDAGKGWWDWLLRWREGKHGGKKPASPRPPQPREFAFEVEYSTFEDKIYRLGDLTVNSLVGLAVRIGERVDNAKTRMSDVVGWGGDEVEGCAEEIDGEWEETEREEQEEDEDEGSDEEVEAEKKKKKGKKGRKGRKGKKRRKQNETWLHFLKHAFVGTLEEEELRKFD